MPNSFTLDIIMPQAVFEQQTSVIFTHLYKSHHIVNTTDNPNSVCVTFSYCTDTVVDMISVLENIYKGSGNLPLSVDFLSRKYEIQSSDLHKMILIRVCARNKSEVTSRYRLNTIIKEHKITDLKMLKSLAETPFSRIMLYDRLDHYEITRDPNYLFHHKDPPAKIEIEYSDFSISNRYISQNLHLNRCQKVDIQNCIITGDVMLSSSENVSFWNCIIIGKVTCFGASNISFVECNASHLLIYNCTLDKLTLSWSKIFRFEMHSSHIAVLEMYQNKIVQPYLANLKLPDTKILIDQFKFRNISPKIIQKKSGTPNARFFLTYQINHDIKAVISSEIAIDTVSTLLNNGNFGTDYHTLAVLKYKKLLYSNTGLKKFFVFLTGGFYFPSRWLLYLIVCSVLFAFAYWTIPNGFADLTTGNSIQIDFLTALQYSLLQIIDTNTFPFSCKGFCQILTVIHATLNTTLVANFFASIIKKCMD